MSSRHTRRKAAKAKQLAKTESIANAARAANIAAIVRANMSAPISRNAYKSAAPIDNVKANVYTGYREPRASGGMTGRSVVALKAKGAKFGGCDMLMPDDAAIEGQRLSGRAIREQEAKRLREASLRLKGLAKA